MPSLAQGMLYRESGDVSGGEQRGRTPHGGRCVAVGMVLLAAAAALAQQSAPKPVASVTQLMQAMVIPASNALFDVARNAPQGEQEWTAVENQAVILAESGNLLMIGDRARDSDTWMSTSRILVEAGAAALRAAEARDSRTIADVGNRIIEACETCHEEHWIR